MPNTEPDTKEPPILTFFDKVDELRKHMILNMGQMAKIIGVSRVTYMGWVKGKPIRPKNKEQTITKVKLMLELVKKGWPEPNIIAMTPLQRFNTLLEKLNTKQ